MKKKCCVIGLGYIGLPTSIIAASSGFEIIGVDKNEKVVNSLNKGIIHIVEPNLKEAFQEILEKKLFKAQLKPDVADIFIIAVPTPFQKKSNSYPIPNINYVLDAVESIIPFLKEDNLVILESTSPVGTTEEIADKIFSQTNLRRNQLKIAYCPERVLPGNILNEIQSNDRVIGGINIASAKAAKEFYSKFSFGKYNLTNTKTAELVKLTENSYRDVNIAFANELSMICSEFDIDPQSLIKIANCHPRVNILNPGPGVGGHCIAVDPWFIVSKTPNQSTLIRTAREVNIKKTNWVINKIKSSSSKFEAKIKRKPIIGCFGVTFKPDVDDVRESSALKIIKELCSQKFNIICCDPLVKNLEGFKFESSDKLVDICDICVFLVAHTKFKNLKIKKSQFLDFCGITTKN